MLTTIQHIIETSKISPSQMQKGVVQRVASEALGVLPFFLAWTAIQWSTEGAIGIKRWTLLSLALIVIFFAQLILSYAGQMNCFVGAYEVMMGYQSALIDHLRKLPLGQLQAQRIGSLASLLTDGVKKVENIFTHLVAEVIAGICIPLFFAFALVWVNWKLTVSLLITVPIGIGVLVLFNTFLLHHSQRQVERFSQASSQMIEYVSGIQTLRLFNNCDALLKPLEANFKEIQTGSIWPEVWGGGGVQLFRIIVELGLVCLLTTGAWLMSSHELDASTWILFILVSYKIIDPLLEVSAYIMILNVMQQSARNLSQFHALPTQPETTSTPTPKDFNIEFKNVCFSYNNKNPVLQNISFKAPPSTVTAIVGGSGEGKSTLLHLLGRFYEPQKGEITIGQIPLNTLGSNQIYDLIGFVFQDVQLFEGSVTENIRIGKPDATDEEVRLACQAAHCEQFILQLPQGYETPLGENAQRLSGGERQRLSIARMLLKNPPIILLDEATASVDPYVQKEIQESLSLLVQGRTVLMIAHRLRTIEYVDQILVLNHGNIVQTGTHHELISCDGVYAKMWKEQSKNALAT